MRYKSSSGANTGTNKHLKSQVLPRSYTFQRTNLKMLIESFTEIQIFDTTKITNINITRHSVDTEPITPKGSYQKIMARSAEQQIELDKKQQKNEEKLRGKEAKQRRKSIFLTRTVSVFSQNCLSLPHEKPIKRANTLPADMEFKPYMRKIERKSFKKSVSKFLSFVHAS